MNPWTPFPHALPSASFGVNDLENEKKNGDLIPSWCECSGKGKEKMGLLLIHPPEDGGKGEEDESLAKLLPDAPPPPTLKREEHA